MDRDSIAEDAFYFVRYIIDDVPQSRRLHRDLASSLEDVETYFANLSPRIYYKRIQVYRVDIPEQAQSGGNT